MTGPVPSANAGAVREEDQETDRFRVTILAFSTVLLLAAGWIVSGALVAKDTPPLVVATGRTAGSFFVLAIIAAMTAPGRAGARIVSQRPWIVAKLAFIGYVIYFGGTMLAVARIGASRTGLVVALLPCITLAVGIVGFGERATLRKAAGTVTAVGAAIGYSVVTRSGHTAHDFALENLAAGIGFALVATISFAVYGYVYKNRMHDIAPASALPALFGVATVMLIPATAATIPLGGVSSSRWLTAFALGAVLTAPVYLTGHELFLRRGPLFVAAIALVVPFLVRMGDWALGNASPPDLPSMVFMALCLGGVTAVVR